MGTCWAARDWHAGRGRRAAVMGLMAALTAWGDAAAVLATADRPAVATIAQSETRSVRDGVFTEEQAVRGKAAYTEACSSCHREDLSGNEDGAPPLGGDAFLERWTGRRLSEFLFVLSETMPQDAPNSLTSRMYTDIICFLLKRNGAPAGKTELQDDPESLAGIRFAPAPRLRQ